MKILMKHLFPRIKSRRQAFWSYRRCTEMIFMPTLILMYNHCDPWEICNFMTFIVVGVEKVSCLKLNNRGRKNGLHYSQKWRYRIWPGCRNQVRSFYFNVFFRSVPTFGFLRYYALFFPRQTYVKLFKR